VHDGRHADWRVVSRQESSGEMAVSKTTITRFCSRLLVTTNLTLSWNKIGLAELTLADVSRTKPLPAGSSIASSLVFLKLLVHFLWARAEPTNIRNGL
jgi:hypothetical protein